MQKSRGMTSLIGLSTFGVLLFISTSHSYDQLDSITDSLLREVVGRMGGPGESMATNYDDYGTPSNTPTKVEVKPVRNFEARRDAILGREPSIRDKEYLQHSTLTGHQSIQGGAGEGYQRLKPDGSMKNFEVLKTDSLPSFCNPPNPCPLGYKADDGCLEEFENTATFSREYQGAQDCMCDSEHMFDCPGATRENEIDALARSFENEGLAELTLDRLFQDMEIGGDHKVVAKKFFKPKTTNPYLEGEKLPVVAKKAPTTSIK